MKSLAKRAQLMREAYESGKTLAEVGAEFGVSYQRVAQILETLGVPRRRLSKPPLPTAVAAAVVAEHMEGADVADIAARHECGHQAVRDAIKGHRRPCCYVGKARAELAAEVAELYRDKQMPVMRIRDLTGLNHQTIRKLLREAGVEMRKPGRIGGGRRRYAA